jgi:hypothetical protein
VISNVGADINKYVANGEVSFDDGGDFGFPNPKIQDHPLNDVPRIASEARTEVGHSDLLRRPLVVAKQSPLRQADW